MFVSTDPADEACVSFEETLRRPIPSKGHLWMPQTLPRIAWPDSSKPLHAFVEEALLTLTGTQFDFESCLCDVPVDVSESTQLKILNLHRGPTKSFKDVGCLCAAHIYQSLGMKDRTIVATSGDTGSAAANAFQLADLPITVLFPKDRISPFQAAQMLDCEKATIMAVEGDFDACQSHVKTVISQGNAQSCNSISLARLLPQIGYYAWLAANHAGLNVIVPSGNFGNACAAEMARRMGAPIARVHFACNENDAVARFVNGLDDTFTPKPTVETPATAMDVGHPSNFIRIMHLCNDATILRQRFTATVVRSENIRVSRHYTFQEEKLCPHTAVAACAAAFLQLPNMCIVRTADACKFEDSLPMPYAPVCLKPEKALVRKQNIVLVGMPSSGKSTIGRALNGVDTDALICEAQGKPLHEVIAARSVDEFLQLEANISGNAVKELEGKVIATGGSVIYTSLFRNSLDDSLVVWLDAEMEDLRERLGDSWNSRGVVSPHNTTDLEALYDERVGFFREIADVRINTTQWNVDRISAFLKTLV